MSRRGGALRAFAYRVFHALPKQVRRLIVRGVRPSFMVGAVTILQDGAGRLLLLRQPPGHGWNLPGGLINRGERPDECAARELAEETGIRLADGELVPAVPNAVAHPKVRWIDFVFEARLSGPVPELVVDGAEILEGGWFAPDALPPLTVVTARLLARYGIGPYVAYPEVHR